MKAIRDMLVDELRAAELQGVLAPKTVHVFVSTLDLCAVLRKMSITGTPDEIYAVSATNEAFQAALKEWLVDVQAE